MAENKKSFLLYTDIEHTVLKLTDVQAGQLFKHLLSYVTDKDPIAPDFIIEIAFEPIKQQLKRDLVKYDEIRGKRSDAGKLSAEKKKHIQQVLTSVNKRQQTSTHSTVNGIVNVNDNDIKEISFNQFWDLYDKKVGSKDKLLSKWNKLSQSDIDLILQYIPKYKISQPDKKFRKDPETFLNNKSWNDEIIETQKNKITEPKPEIWNHE